MKTPDLTSPAQLLSKADFAKQLQVTIRTVENWLNQGRLSKLKIGRTVRISPDEVENFMAKHTLHASGTAGRR